MSFNDDASSIASMLSEMSVNVDGKEMNLQSYISETFKGIQGHINRLEVCVTYLAFAEDRGMTLEEYLPKFLELMDHILESTELFEGLSPAMIDCLELEGETKKQFKQAIKEHKQKQKEEKKKRREKQLEHVEEFKEK